MQTYTIEQMKKAWIHGGKTANNILKGLDYIDFEDWINFEDFANGNTKYNTLKKKRKK